VEFVPFRHAIACGADAVMTAHVVFPAIEPEGVPATLSRRMLTGLLREEMGFDGVIATDCMEMNAIAGTIGVAGGAVEAIRAGADLVLVSHRLEQQKAALEAVKKAVLNGDIPESRMDEAVGRLWRLKRQRGLFDRFAGTPDAAAAEAVARQLCERAVTVVKGGDALPLARGCRVAVVWAEPRARTEVIEVLPQQWTLGEALKAEGYDVVEARIGSEPTPEEAQSARLAAAAAGKVVFVSYDAGFSAAQAALIRELCARRKRGEFVLAAGRTPYDLLAVPEVPVYICTYENKPAMMTALAGVLSGRIAANARLPVTIGEYACGS